MRGVPLAGQQPLRLHRHRRRGLTGRQPQVEVRPSRHPLPLHGKALALAVS